MTRLLVRTAATVMCCLSPTLLPADEPAQTQASPELEIQILFDSTSPGVDRRIVIDNGRLTVTTLPVKEQASNK